VFTGSLNLREPGYLSQVVKMALYKALACAVFSSLRGIRFVYTKAMHSSGS
jgi:hypothetical protein